MKDLSLTVLDFFYVLLLKLGYIRLREKMVKVPVQKIDMPSIIRSSEMLSLVFEHAPFTCF